MKIHNRLLYLLIAIGLGLFSAGTTVGQQKTAKEDLTITAEELLAKMKKNEPVIILDTRTEGQYKASNLRIKGDIRINEEDELATKLKDVAPDRLIVAYCT
ncbi:MAG: rhodanese-like domain-containing protein [Acidobacteriota bacterium]